MKLGTHKKNGLAIITTMLILTLLLGLIAAFLVVNRAGNRFTMGSVERRTAQDVCLTAFYYAWWELEQERLWGDKDQPAVTGTVQYPHVNPQIRLTRNQTLGEPLIRIEGVYSLSGNFVTPQATFTMTVENNLKANETQVSALSDARNIPARSVRIEVLAEVGGVTKKLTTMLRPEPISHDSLSAGNDVNLESTSGLVRLESRDPYVNRLQAGNNLNLPDSNEVKFLRHGIGASQNELNVGSTDLAQASDDLVRQFGEASGGVYKPGAGSQSIKEFDPDDFTLPTNTTNIPDGTWTFGDVTAIEYIAHTLEYATPPPPGSTGGGGVDTTIRYQRRTSQYNQLTSPTGQVYTAGQAMEGTEVLDPPYDPSSGVYEDYGAASDYGYGDNSDATDLNGTDVVDLAPGFRANIVTAQMVVHPEYALKSSGDFIVEATGDRKPELYFGYDLTGGGVATQLSLVDGLEAAQKKPAKYMAGIVANGDVNVTGGVLGYGSMIAGGDLTIKASSGLRVAPELGVVVKGNRVIINPATEPEPSFPGQPVPVDYPVFRDSIQAESGGDWSQYNNWLNHEQPTRDSIIASLGATSTGSDPAVLWNTLCEQVGTTIEAPNFVGTHGWPPGPATVAQYARLKEFFQTRASGFNGGNGDVSWLDLSSRQEDAAGRVAGTLNSIAQWARTYKQSFQQYLTTDDQTPPDMFLEGLVYADEDILVDATGKSIRLEGTVVARNNITINDATRVDLVYNRELLDSLTDPGESGGPVRLEKVFFTLD
ncbi:MAG: hypothetical protein WC314_09375 [Vulcanimicrobiota bacterium]